MLRSFMTAALVTCVAAGQAVGDEPEHRAALRVRVVRPTEQGDRLLGLFRDARARDPAAALAAWKQAGGGKVGLGKPLEAAISALNPSMIRELRILDGASFVAGLGPGTEGLRWRAEMPSDDGSLAALAAALALTDGAIDEPLGADPVLRLGPPGSALAIRREGRLVLASDRNGLTQAPQATDGRDDLEASRSGWYVRLDPAGLHGLTSLNGRRTAEALEASGCLGVRGRAALEGETVAVQVRARFGANALGRSGRGVELSWLDDVPASGVLAAVCVAFDAGPRSLDAAFTWLDRVEKADPARAGVAPLRVRLNLIAAAAGVRPEIDLWPGLRGLTAVWLVDGRGQTAGAIVSLHTTGPDSARRVADRVVFRIISSRMRPGGVQRVAPGLAEANPLGVFRGKPLFVEARGDCVRIRWGDRNLPASPETAHRGTPSPLAALSAGWKDAPPQRLGALWVGRLRGVPPGSALSRALADAPAVVWEGRTDKDESVDTVQWSGLRGLIRRWLEDLPMQPPPDRSAR